MQTLGELLAPSETHCTPHQHLEGGEGGREGGREGRVERGREGRREGRGREGGRKREKGGREGGRKREPIMKCLTCSGFPTYPICPCGREHHPKKPQRPPGADSCICNFRGCYSTPAW